jgi:hypothetical protein
MQNARCRAFRVRRIAGKSIEGLGWPHLILTSMRQPSKLVDPLFDGEMDGVDSVWFSCCTDCLPLDVILALTVILYLPSLMLMRQKQMI